MNKLFKITDYELLSQKVYHILKKGIIVGIEIENFSDVLKKFDCDKKENIKELNKMVKK